jgi:uncharacterized RDD family membrane protein YckC
MRAQGRLKIKEEYKVHGMLMNCPNCGLIINKAADKCEHCGKSPVNGAKKSSSGFEKNGQVAGNCSGEFSYPAFWKRVVAFYIDSIVVLPVLVIINRIQIYFDAFWVGIILLILYWLYFAFLESSPKQATLGKMAMKIIITDMKGARISFNRASQRCCAKLVSTSTFGIGFLMAKFTRKKQALHDILSECLVIERK